MRMLGIHLCTLLLLSTPATGQTIGKAGPDTTGGAVALARSRAAAEDLLSTLKSVLSAHMASGGPAQAVTACSDTAQVLTEQVELRHGLTIRRVSERWRSALDEPDPYETALLRRFDILARSDSLTPESEHAEITLEGSQRVFRYMKPITVQPACLSCHGPIDRLHPAVIRILGERYPDDTAVQYREGDLRGAVTVTVELK